MKTQTDVIEFPYSCTKSQLQYLYAGQMTVLDIRNGINAIIEESRKGIDAKKVHRIWYRELREFVSTYGVPGGYVLPKNF